MRPSTLSRFRSMLLLAALMANSVMLRCNRPSMTDSSSPTESDSTEKQTPAAHASW
jgi:hypothetical protein